MMTEPTFFFEMFRQEKEPKPKPSGPDIFRWGGGLPREGMGAKKFGMSFDQYLSLQSNLKHVWFTRKFREPHPNPPVRMNFPGFSLKTRLRERKFIRTGGFRCGSRTFARTSHISDWIVGRGTDSNPKEAKLLAGYPGSFGGISWGHPKSLRKKEVSVQFLDPICSLSGPVLRDAARLSQRYPPIARYGVSGVSTWPSGCDTPSPFSERSPRGEHAKWRCDTPPLKKGHLSDTYAIPYKNKANGCDTPLCDTISKRYCAIWGVSRTGPLSLFSVVPVLWLPNRIVSRHF